MGGQQAGGGTRNCPATHPRYLTLRVLHRMPPQHHGLGWTTQDLLPLLPLRLFFPPLLLLPLLMPPLLLLPLLLLLPPLLLLLLLDLQPRHDQGAMVLTLLLFLGQVRV